MPDRAQDRPQLVRRRALPRRVRLDPPRAAGAVGELELRALDDEEGVRAGSLARTDDAVNAGVARASHAEGRRLLRGVLLARERALDLEPPLEVDADGDRVLLAGAVRLGGRELVDALVLAVACVA